MSLPQHTDLANDNGKSEDHLAAATAALHTAVKGLDAPVEVLASKINHLSNERRSVDLHRDLVWEQGIVEKTPFDAEKAARDHVFATFPARKRDDGIVAVEMRRDDGTVVFSRAGGS